MTVKEVLTKYHKIVPFPVSIKRIQKAGLTPGEYLTRITNELETCDDIGCDSGRRFFDAIDKIKKSLN